MIVKAPRKILDSKTKEVTEINGDIKKLVDKMISVKDQEKAVGLAANQIGQSHRIAVIGYKDEKDEVSIPEIVMINPIITWKSPDSVTQKERCLSVTEREYDVPRAKKIHVHYLDIEGNKKKLKARGILARIIQHEIDHLDGKKISDYK
jgi:peptide deformylase